MNPYWRSVSEDFCVDPKYGSLNLNLLSAPTGGSVADWLACWTQAQKGLGSNRSRDELL